jgi:flagellar biosynthesis protein FlhB
MPAPVQAFRDAATQTGPAVPAAVPVAPGAVTPEVYHPAKPKVGVARRTRKARLRLSRLDPWSVMKTSFLFSIAAGIMLVVAVYSIWTVLGTSGLFNSINDIVGSVVSTPGDTTPFRIEEYINTHKVMGVTALIACVDVVIFTALATLGSFLYNLAATMLGGLEITLAED